MSTLLVVVATATAIFIAFVAIIWHSQERMVFQPPAPPYPDARSVRRLDYTASDGQPLFAYVVGDPSPANGLVIVFHGNADLAGWQIPWAEEVGRRSRRAVLLVEYRGYAGLPGAPTYEGAARDARAAYLIARDTLGIPDSRIALFGHSLGSAIATELAREVAPEVLVLQSPFTSARDMSARVGSSLLLLVWNRIARVHYDTEAVVRALATPVWVAHGTDDSVVPVRMGERVFAAVRNRGELLIIAGANHNDVAERDPQRYWEWLMRALSASQPGR